MLCVVAGKQPRRALARPAVLALALTGLSVALAWVATSRYANDGSGAMSAGTTAPQASASAGDVTTTALPADSASTTDPVATSNPAASTTTAVTAPTTIDLPPDATSYSVTDNESLPQAKTTAVRFVEALLTYEADHSLAEVVHSATDDPVLAGRLEPQVAPLHHAGMWSRPTVIYPQLGGHRNNRASVMIVVRQELGVGSDVIISRTRTLDTRVDLVGGQWVFVDLPDIGGMPVERPDDLSPEAIAVVDNPRIVLADSAYWDIYAGRITPGLLQVMADLAEITPYAAVVLESGHPHNVFGTDRVSNHTVGRAVDIYLFDDTKVIDNEGNDSRIREIVEWAYDNPMVSEVGSPWALDGYGGRSFTDDVHLDHVHIGAYG